MNCWKHSSIKLVIGRFIRRISENSKPIFVNYCIGVQFLNRRFRMKGSFYRDPYRFLTNRSESKFAKEGFRVKRRIYFLFI